MKIEHSECLKQIEKLKSELEILKEPKELSSDIETRLEEQTLLEGKLGGFSRECPQSEPQPKPFLCNVCGKEDSMVRKFVQLQIEMSPKGDWAAYCLNDLTLLGIGGGAAF